MYRLESRHLITVNNDPQKRCYNGCHFSTETFWSGWDWLELEIPENEIENRLTFWRELNDYAVSQRGKGAKKEFRKVLIGAE